MNDFVFDAAVFKQALDTHAIVSVTDVQGNILHVNDLFCQVSEYSRAELLGQNHRIIKSQEHAPEVYRDMWRTIAQGGIWQGEIKNNKKNGGYYWVKTSIMPVMNDAGKPDQYISIRTEITDRKIAEAQLLQRREKLKTALRVKSEFLSRMSHEIRTPLNGVIGLADVLADTKLDDVQIELLTELKSCSDGLMRLLLNLLDFEEVSAGHKTLEIAEINVADFVAEITRHWQKIATAKGVEFVCRMAGSLPKNMTFDRSQTRRILDELLDNAFKFTKNGQVTLCAYPQQDAKIVIEVHDTGIGIPADAIAQILEPFGQLDSTISRQNDGAGVGLALCNEMIKRMGGEMCVESEPGKGTKFKIVMPV
jgi:two-component system, sensor histidine kinase and response regulator